jgi:hypothetical protein
VQGARIKSISVFPEGDDVSSYDIELFTKATSDASPCSDRYRRLNKTALNGQQNNILSVGEELILEDQEAVKAGVYIPTKEQLHIRITNNGAGSMHITDIEILFEKLIPPTLVT